MSDATLEGNVKTLNLPSEEVMLDENGNRLGTGEVTDFKDGKIIWNFYNDENTKIVTGEMAGAVIAPHATLSLKSSFNGTAIAKNVSNETESHRTDFTGILQNDATSFFVQKSFSEGQQWPENSKYHFKFESVTNSTTKKQPMPENREIVIDSSTKDHTKAFGDITYSNEEDSNDEKYYYYKIEEDRDTGNDDYVDTVKYDTNVYYIRVKVKYTANVTLGIRKAEIEETSYIDTKTTTGKKTTTTSNNGKDNTPTYKTKTTTPTKATTSTTGDHGSGTTNTYANKRVKTGDETHIAIYVILMATAGVLLILVGRFMRND